MYHFWSQIDFIYVFAPVDSDSARIKVLSLADQVALDTPQVLGGISHIKLAVLASGQEYLSNTFC